MRRLIAAAAERIVDHIASLPQQPSVSVENADALARSVIEPLPTQPTPFDELLAQLFDELIPCSFNTAGPGYLAYIPGGGLFQSALADFIATSTNRYVGVYAAAPALVQLETNVIRWLCEIVGYERGSGGVLTSGGSMSNFIAVVTARRELLPENFLRGTLYVSEQVHHSLQKAASLAGFPFANVREIATDEQFRMRIDALEETIARDRREGFTPFFVVGSAGTTGTGAVDDLDALAGIAARERLWFHVDGAYGGFFLLTARGREVMRGVERADSIVLDPHKTLFLPYGTGGLVVRDAAALRRAHSAHADYLPQMQSEDDFVDFCEVSPELSRDFRGLRVWLPLKMFGIEPFRQQLDEKLDLTLFAADELRAMRDIEIVAEPQLSIVAFRLNDGRPEDQLNDVNRRLLERVNARKRVMITPTVIDGRFILRICVVSFRTHREQMQMAIDDIAAALDEIAPLQERAQ